MPDHLREVTMEAQVEKGGQDQKGELLGELRAKLVSRTIKDITPFGVKLEVNGEGLFSGNKFSGKQMETVVMNQYGDGTLEWENRSMINTMEGEVILFVGHGRGKATGPTTVWGEGEDLCMTQAPRLSSLNGQRFRTEVTGDQATGEYQVKVYTKK